MSNETVTISVEEYNRLALDSKKLGALESAGVSDWEWYYEAIGSVEDQSDDDDDDSYWDDEDGDD